MPALRRKELYPSHWLRRSFYNSRKFKRDLFCVWHTNHLCMPAKSKKQQMAAGAALAAKRGKRSKSSLRGASRAIYKSMSKAELRRMAKTKRKGKPTKKKRR